MERVGKHEVGIELNMMRWNGAKDRKVDSGREVQWNPRSRPPGVPRPRLLAVDKISGTQ